MRRAVAAALAAALAALAAPAVAGASCIPTAAEDLFDRSEAAFTGTLVEEREATYVFDVGETLRGGPLPARVEVVDEGHLTSVAMGLAPGEQAGIVARARRGEQLVANGCLQTGPGSLREIARRAELCRPGLRGAATVVLGCARPGPAAERYRFAARRRDGRLCVELVELDSATRIRCGGGLRRGRAVWADGVLREAGDRLLTGAARAGASRVDVSFRHRGERQRVDAGLTDAVAGAGLRRLGLRRAFRRFVVRVPAGARDVVVSARRGGDVLGRHRIAP